MHSTWKCNHRSHHSVKHKIIVYVVNFFSRYDFTSFFFNLNFSSRHTYTCENRGGFRGRSFGGVGGAQGCAIFFKRKKSTYLNWGVVFSFFSSYDLGRFSPHEKIVFFNFNKFFLF